VAATPQKSRQGWHCILRKEIYGAFDGNVSFYIEHFSLVRNGVVLRFHPYFMEHSSHV